MNERIEPPYVSGGHSNISKSSQSGHKTLYENQHRVSVAHGINGGKISEGERSALSFFIIMASASKVEGLPRTHAPPLHAPLPRMLCTSWTILLCSRLQSPRPGGRDTAFYKLPWRPLVAPLEDRHTFLTVRYRFAMPLHFVPIFRALYLTIPGRRAAAHCVRRADGYPAIVLSYPRIFTQARSIPLLTNAGGRTPLH